MQRKFVTYCLLFFLPVIAGYLLIEYVTRELPSSFKSNKTYIANNTNNLETLILGSSQMQSAVNPAWLSSPTLNLASGDQHHDTDYKLLKAFVKRLPNLKTVVLEASYSHFEFRHNQKDFWKNALYLTFYDVNTFERNTYFKDGFIYLSNPPFFSKKIDELYFNKTRKVSYNRYGFNTKNFYGQFKWMDFDEARINAMPNFKINTTPNLSVFKPNVQLFYEMINFANHQGLKVVVCKPPMYKTYLKRRNIEILRRRDSVVFEVLKKFPSVRVMELEEDTITFGVRDYWNQSHLNPDGAKKFASLLNAVLEQP